MGLLFGCLVTGCAHPRGDWHSVAAHGAAGKGQALETQALQSAIDAASAAGGGTVYFPPGRYLSGTLVLRSRVTLWLDAGATLLGSTVLSDYPEMIPALRSYTDNYTRRSLLYGENLESVAIRGGGTIDGQGAAFKGPYLLRPYLVRVITSRGITVENITLRDSPMWVQHYLACENLLIRGIRVESRCNHNNDGIDIDGCRNVRISDCDISSGDDAIVLKSTSQHPCDNVAVTNCVLSTDCNGIKLGTESNGGFRNIAISNCTLYDVNIAGLALEMVDGGTLENVTATNLTMQNVATPIFVRLGNRARPFKEEMARPGVGALRRVVISNVVASGAKPIGCSVTGLPGHPVQDVTLRDIRIEHAGGVGPAAATRPVPEREDAYPESSMFGTLPASGFYCRHVRGLVLDNIRVNSVKPDARPGLVCDDVEDLHVSRSRVNDRPFDLTAGSTP